LYSFNKNKEKFKVKAEVFGNRNLSFTDEIIGSKILCDLKCYFVNPEIFLWIKR
jgi:hypothetical protein